MASRTNSLLEDSLPELLCTSRFVQQVALQVLAATCIAVRPLGGSSRPATSQGSGQD